MNNNLVQHVIDNPGFECSPNHVKKYGSCKKVSRKIDKHYTKIEEERSKISAVFDRIRPRV